MSLNEQRYYLSASKGKDKDRKHESQTVISINKPENALEICKERWQIVLLSELLKQVISKY
ncbi:MAG: hypothetical protein Q7J34_03945 [Bacteroidales bacterium]|nr:hypothetical protein [Bacteroidales bacterium]